MAVSLSDCAFSSSTEVTQSQGNSLISESIMPCACVWARERARAGAGQVAVDDVSPGWVVTYRARVPRCRVMSPGAKWDRGVWRVSRYLVLCCDRSRYLATATVA